MQAKNDPIAVIQAVNRAADSGDITGMVAFFSDKAVVKLDPPLPAPFRSEYRGRPEIRSYVNMLVTHGFHVDSSNFSAKGDEVTWHSRITGGPFGEEGIEAEADSQAVVRDGLIDWLKVHYSPQSVQALSQALSHARQPQ